MGVDDKGRLIFAITDKGEMVNFWDFAGLFLKLGCKNALFLDGDISQMSVNPDKPVSSNRFGACSSCRVIVLIPRESEIQ